MLLKSGQIDLMPLLMPSGWWYYSLNLHKYYLSEDLWKAVMLELKGFKVELLTGI